MYEGEVLLEGNGVPSLHLPFVFYVGKTSVDNDLPLSITLTNRIASTHSPIDITLHFNGGYNVLQLALLDNDGNYYGLLGNWSSFENGFEQFVPKSDYVIEDFNGSYLSPEQSGANGSFDLPSLPDGQYVLSAYAAYALNRFVIDKQFSSITINVDHNYTGGEQPGDGDPGSGNPGGGNGEQPGSGTPQTSNPAPTPPKSDADVTASVIAADQKTIALNAKTMRQPAF